MFDTHCHIAPYPDFFEIYKRARDQCVDHILVAGCSVGQENAMLEQISQVENVYSSIGVHPHEASRWDFQIYPWIEYLNHPRVVAIGEIGLDYHYNFSPPATQRKVFSHFIELAIEKNLPIIVHVRESEEDAYTILKDFAITYQKRYRPTDNLVPFVIHCFSSGPKWAEQFLSLGGYLSFTGIITFKNANDVRDALKITPKTRFFLETDAPYLAPVPYRGKKNEPAYLPLIVQATAEILTISREEAEHITTQNAFQFFRVSH